MIINCSSTLAQLLKDGGEGGVVQAQSAVLFREGDAKQPRLFHLFVNEFVGHNAFFVQLGRHRLNVALDEVADQADDLGAGSSGVGVVTRVIAPCLASIG